MREPAALLAIGQRLTQQAFTTEGTLVEQLYKPNGSVAIPPALGTTANLVARIAIASVKAQRAAADAGWGALRAIEAQLRTHSGSQASAALLQTWQRVGLEFLKAPASWLRAFLTPVVILTGVLSQTDEEAANQPTVRVVKHREAAA